MFRKLSFPAALLLLLIQGGQALSQDAREPARSCYRLDSGRYYPLPFMENNRAGNLFSVRFERGEAREGKQVFLDLPFIGSPYSLRINDFSLAGSAGGGPAPEYNITPFLNGSGNRIDIGIEGPGPDSAWLGGCREAFLLVREGIHVRDVEVRTYTSQLRPGALVRIRLWIKSYTSGKSESLHLDLEVRGPEGNTEFKGSLQLSSPLSFGQETEMILDGTVAAPRPWSPLDPALYSLEIRQAGTVTGSPEILSMQFGIRDLVLSDTLLIAAGDTLPLLPAGKEMTDAMLTGSREEASRLLERKTFNAIFTSAPVPCCLMRLFEEQGLLVIRQGRDSDSDDRPHVNSPALFYAE